MEGLTGTNYPKYSEEFYAALERFRIIYRPSLYQMIPSIRNIENKQCGGEYFLYDTPGRPRYSELSDSCKTLAELDRIFTKIHDGNFNEL